MNIRNLLWAMVVTIPLTTASKAMAYYSTHVSQHSFNLGTHIHRVTTDQAQLHRSWSHTSEYQETRLDIDAAKLKQAHILTIQTNRGIQMSGGISINGTVIRRLASNDISIDLAPYLSIGINTIEISGTYHPVNLPIQVTLMGPDVNIAQQTSGTGLLSYTLVLIAE